MFDKLKEECGVFGIWGAPEAANLTYLGLHALQHRGQEGAGIVSNDGVSLHMHKDLGLVGDIFGAKVLERLPGEAAIGHVRYSTAGGGGIKNAQPFAVQTSTCPLAIAHNGNLVNADSKRRLLEEQGAIFFSSSDTEVVLHLVARRPEAVLHERISAALREVDGAYSLLFMSDEQLIGVRDPHGFRPLILGKLKNAFVLASETCALDLIEAEYIREIEPGEMVVISKEGLQSLRPFEQVAAARCIFEHVYFARPDSVLFGQSVYATRTRLGAQLATEHPVEADLVIPVPDSGVPAAIGYAAASGIPFGMGLVRSHYVGRTFIEPSQSIRHFGVKLKLNALGNELKGKRVVVIDDSIVRGTTSRKIVKMLRNAGAKEVHLRISSPPTAWPCYYGIDTPTRQELIASSHSTDEITKYVTADSLGYLSTGGLHDAVGSRGEGYCDACFTGNYRVQFPKDEEKRSLRVLEA
ncbi:amidophosphoribosyltransferase [Vulgatibacter sp.]|uniref:amidophosphoribosyltransferase n=1 Tax=Vulgatibacter sp. TaxID=1971226 RepID=UPI00356B0B59